MFLDVFQAKTESKWKQRLIFWDASFDQQFLLDEAETTSQSGLKKSCRSNPGHVRQDLKKTVMMAPSVSDKELSRAFRNQFKARCFRELRLWQKF